MSTSATTTRLRRWRSLHPAVRVIVVIVVAFVVLNVALGLLDSFTSEADRGRRASDPSSTQPDGTSAWVELLRRNDVAVQTQPLDNTDLGASPTVVALDEQFEEEDIQALADHVERGGRVVAGPEVATVLLAVISDEYPGWTPSNGGDVVTVAEVPETEGVSEIATRGEGAWEPPEPLDPILAGDDRVVVAAGDVGEGRVVALADVSVVQNRTLGEADNAAFAINLAGDQPVVFMSSGSSEPTGLAAIPSRWWIALVGGVLAFLLGAIAVGRRIGPPDAPASEEHPPRHTYAESIGLTLERTRRPDEALDPLRRHVREGLARRGGLPVGAGDDEVRAVARRLGWPEADIDVVFTPASDATMLSLGDALARLTTSDDPERPVSVGTLEEGTRR